MARGYISNRKVFYFKRRGSRKLPVIVRLFMVIIILSLLASYADRMLVPVMTGVCMAKARDRINSAVDDSIKKEPPEYEQFMDIKRDGNGRLLSMEVNYSVLNRFSTEVSENVQEKLNFLESQKIYVPSGTLLGSSIFSGSGPHIGIKVLLLGNVKTEIKSYTEKMLQNHIKHVIKLKVTTTISIAAPLISTQSEIVTYVPLSENIIAEQV